MRQLPELPDLVPPPNVLPLEGNEVIVKDAKAWQMLQALINAR